MTIVSLKAGASDLPKEVDLAIVGSGPAGLTVAQAFRDSRVRVCILESGGMEPSRETEALNEIVSVGQRRAHHEAVRRRCVGGSSAIWTGRCGMFDAIDYQERPWLPLSGWPIDAQDLDPYVMPAGALLGLTPTVWPRQALRDLEMPFDRPAWDSDVLWPAVWQFSRRDGDAEQLPHASDEDGELAILRHSGRQVPVDFGRAHAAWLAASKNVTLLTEATVLEIEAASEGRRATGVRFRGPDGSDRHLKARKVVLACGGIDNARLLLCSRSAAGSGLGNDRDQVGRYLCDHTFTELGTYGPGAGRRLRRRMWARLHRVGGGKQVFSFGVRLSPALQRREGLTNAAAYIVEFGGQINALAKAARGIRAIRNERAISSGLADISGALSHPVDLATSLLDRLAFRRTALDRPDRAVLGCAMEQPLNPDSRIRLADARDRYGTPLPEIDWRIDDAEYRTARRFREIMIGELGRLRLELPETPAWVEGGIEAWRETLVDLAHPMCTTRMSDDPATGVVDADCRVHGVDNLYVAGSSVFATPGHMNPTQMIVALALRLADRLRNEFHAEGAAPATARRTEDTPAPLKVGIVGAGDRTRHIYAPVLGALKDRFAVVGVSSRTRQSAERLAAETGWAVWPEVGAMVAEAEPDLIVAAVASGDISTVHHMLLGHGKPVFVETPLCWNLRAGRKLARRVQGQGTAFGVAEQFPFLPVAQLQRKVVELGGLGAPRAAVNGFAIFDYHGIARLRAVLGLGPRPADVANRSVEIGSVRDRNGQFEEEIWDDALIRYRSGEVLRHLYSPVSSTTPARTPGSFDVLGSEGHMSAEEIGFVDAKGRAVTAAVERQVEDGRLISLSVMTSLGPVVWRNPFADHALDDEQIGVASALTSFADAVMAGGAAPYDSADALLDMEILAAMRASRARNGRPVPVLTSPIREKARRTLRRRLRMD